MDYHADVVLVGHDHDYERFDTLDTTGAVSPNGIAEFVIGTGGADLINYGGTQTSTTLAFTRAAHGILRLALKPGGYDWKFLPIAGDEGKFAGDQGSAGCH